MFVGESLVSFVFRLLNFIILGGLGVYLFKRYGLPSVRQQVKEQDAHIIELKQRRDTLKETLRALEQQSYEQAITCNQLTLKIGRWHDAAVAQQRKDYEEKQRLITLLARKVHQQEQTVALQNLKKQVFPAALAQTKERLEHQFNTQEAGTKYIENLLRFMETGKL